MATAPGCRWCVRGAGAQVTRRCRPARKKPGDPCGGEPADRIDIAAVDRNGGDVAADPVACSTTQAGPRRAIPARHPVGGCAAGKGERSARVNESAGHDDRSDGAVHPAAERRPAAAIPAGDAAGRDAASEREVAADQHVATGTGQGVYRRVDAAADVLPLAAVPAREIAGRGTVRLAEQASGIQRPAGGDQRVHETIDSESTAQCVPAGAIPVRDIPRQEAACLEERTGDIDIASIDGNRPDAPADAIGRVLAEGKEAVQCRVETGDPVTATSRNG